MTTSRKIRFAGLLAMGLTRRLLDELSGRAELRRDIEVLRRERDRARSRASYLEGRRDAVLEQLNNLRLEHLYRNAP